MKNVRKIFPIAICSFLLAGGAFAMAKGLSKEVIKMAKAETTSLTLTFTSSGGKAGFNATGAENEIPVDGWDIRLYPKAADSIKINGVPSADFGEAKSWEETIAKIGATNYYFALGNLDSKFSDGAKLTFGGSWVNRIGDVDYDITLDEFTVLWTGTTWIPSVADEDLEPYDVITLRDAGIFEVERTGINTEENGCVAYNSWAPCKGNLHSNFEFSFVLQTYSAEALPEFVVRIGASTSWASGHYFQSNAGLDWGPNGAINFKEYNNGALVWSLGDVNLNLHNSINTITLGNVYLKNEAKQFTYVKVNDVWMAGAIHDVSLALPLKNRIGMYHDSDKIAVRNAWPTNYAGQTVQVSDNAGNQNGIYFKLDPNDGYFIDADWSTRYYPIDRNNLLLNGEPFVGYKQNLLVKYTESKYYVALGDWGYASRMVDGTIFTIRGDFRFVKDGVYYTIHIQQRSFRFNGESWGFYDIADLKDSTFDALQPNDLIRNLGRMKPDHSGSAVKEFDQTITWDAENQREVDTLVYKKDQNGNTGIFFTNSNRDTHGEFRVYLPDNGYKTETKGYALTKLTFDYMLKDSGHITAQGRNHGIDENGFFTPDPGPIASKFIVQAMCKRSDANMYFDREVELVNDGLLHSVTVNMPYADINGFVFVLWNFDGTFFMSNCHADYLEYNQELNDFVTQSLKMYSYVGDGLCGEYYGAAKSAYLALGEDSKALFGTHAAYASAKARLTAWAAANGETFNAEAGTFTSGSQGLSAMNITNNNQTIIIVVASAIAAISLVGVFMIIKRRKMIRK